jgi:hypothetical protein
MSRGSYPFKESDITRAIRASKKAGQRSIIEVDVKRQRFRIIPLDEMSMLTDQNETGQNEWDEIYDQAATPPVRK